MTPEQLAEDQRQRLEGAMIEAVHRHGYAGTTLRELAQLAGVSKSTFYEHFSNKEDCFWAAYESSVGAIGEPALAAAGTGRGRRERLRAAFAAFAGAAEGNPDAASLAIVESLCFGEPGAHRRRRSAERFEAALRECLGGEGARGGAAETAIRGVVGGYRQVAYRGLRDGQPGRLGGYSEELADWALCYRRGAGAAVVPASFFAGLRAAAAEAEEARAVDASDLPGWEEPPGSKRCRRALGQRERIVRAVCQLVVENGFAALSIPAISARAGTSNQTFYQEFSSKYEALEAAFTELSDKALAAAQEAYSAQGSWQRAVAAALAALLDFLAAEPYFAQLAFFGLSAAGAPGLSRADKTMERLLTLFSTGVGAIEAPAIAPVLLEAVGGGIWAVIEAKLDGAGSGPGGAGLVELAPDLADFALRPFS